MNAADWNPALPPEVRRANEIAAEQHAARMEAVQRRAEAERDAQAGQASNDAAFEGYLAENRRRKANPLADLPDDLLTQHQTVDKMRGEIRANRASGINPADEERRLQIEADIAARNEQHQANARAMQEWRQQAYEERVAQLGEVAAERDRRAEATATIDELRRQHRNRL